MHTHTHSHMLTRTHSHMLTHTHTHTHTQETVAALISIHPPEVVSGVDEEDKAQPIPVPDNRPIDFSLGANLDGVPMVMKTNNVCFRECVTLYIIIPLIVH